MANFYTSLEPLCALLRIFGLFSQTFEPPTNQGSLKITKLSLFHTIFAIILLVIAIVCCATHYYYYQVYLKNFLDSSIWSWILFIGFITFLSQIIFQFYKMEEIKKFFELVHTVDRKFNSLSLVIDHSRHRKVVRIVVVSLGLLMTMRIPVIITVYGFILKMFEREYLFMELMFCLFIIYECLFCLQFIIPTFLLRERFKILKGYVR